MSPAATPASVRQQIASGRPAPVYLLQGEDDVEKSAVALLFAELVEEGLRDINSQSERWSIPFLAGVRFKF